MDIRQEKIDELNVILQVTIKPEDYKPKVEKAIKNYVKQAKLPGFRPGKVPYGHIKRLYGKSILAEEVNQLLDEELTNYIRANNLLLLASPLPKETKEGIFEREEQEDYTFSYELGLAPQFDISLSPEDVLPYYRIQLDEDTLGDMVTEFRERLGNKQYVDVVNDGDVLIGKAKPITDKEGVLTKEIPQIFIRTSWIKDEEIKQTLIGLKKGETVELDLAKAYQDPIRMASSLGVRPGFLSKMASTYQLTLQDISRYDQAALNEDFFQQVFSDAKLKSEEEFKAKLSSEIEPLLEQEAEKQFQKEMQKYALKKIQFDMPHKFLKRWFMYRDDKLTEEAVEAQYPALVHDLKWSLIKDKIIQNQKIEATYTEAYEVAHQLLFMHFMSRGLLEELTQEKLSAYAQALIDNKEKLSQLADFVRTRKVHDFLKNMITLEEKPISYKVFQEQQLA